VRSGDITERQRIPKRYLEQVLQHLVRAGILNGKRGPRGGYRLGRERQRITLGEVVRVVRKLEAETEPNDMAIGSPLASGRAPRD
jgi:Rrf2 family iron-sulfur cluster assembly transcriptional regulator